jgi:hypothetical protein
MLWSNPELNPRTPCLKQSAFTIYDTVCPTVLCCYVCLTGTRRINCPLPDHPSIHPSVYIHLSIYLSVIYLSIFLSTILSTYLPTYLPTHLSIYLYFCMFWHDYTHQGTMRAAVYFSCLLVAIYNPHNLHFLPHIINFVLLLTEASEKALRLSFRLSADPPTRSVV